MTAIDLAIDGTVDRLVSGLFMVPIAVLCIGIAIFGLWFLFERVGR